MHTIIDNLRRHVSRLCLDIGSRHVGSAGQAAAAAYIEHEFKALGYPVVREEYPVVGWDFQSFQFWNLSRNCPVPGAVPCFFSQPADISGELYWIPYDRVSDPGEVAGRICFLEYWSDAANVMGRNAIAENLDRLGAAAAIFISDGYTHSSMAASTKIQRSPFLQRLGTCAVAEEGALYLARHKTDCFQVKISARTFPHQGTNVIARCGGSGRRAVLGAHYDTAPLIQGAGDNASGTAMLLELARLLRKTKHGWNLDFAAFDAEEYIPKDFPPGSGDYVKRHLAEDLAWLLNFDDFGLLVGAPVVHVGLADQLPPLRSARYAMSGYCGSGDDKAFHAAGIPTVWYLDRKPWGHLHTSRDSMDTLDFAKMAAGVQDAFELFSQLTTR